GTGLERLPAPDRRGPGGCKAGRAAVHRQRARFGGWGGRRARPAWSAGHAGGRVPADRRRRRPPAARVRPPPGRGRGVAGPSPRMRRPVVLFALALLVGLLGAVSVRTGAVGLPLAELP